MEQPVHGIGLGLRGAFLPEVARGDADGKVAFFEVSPENYMRRGGAGLAHLEAVARTSPLICHGLALSLGGVDPYDPEYLRDLRAFLDRHPWPWYSDHLCFCRHRGVELHDLLPLPFTEAAARRVADRLREAEDRLGRAMLVENISYYLPLGGEMDEVAFITRVLELSGCGLLLDVNNVYVSARNLDVDPDAALDGYLAVLPPDTVGEIHVAGHSLVQRDGAAVRIDDHGSPVCPDVWRLYERALAVLGPVPTLVEWDTALPEFAVLAAEAWQAQRRLDAQEAGRARVA